MNRAMRVEPTPPECALAAEMFDHFCSAGTMKQILALHREICDTLNLKPNRLPDFYPHLKAKLASSWKAQALFKKFDARANHKVYAKGRSCVQTRVLIIGAGPCGLRAAIECQLLGAKVVVIEKRDRISRNNVLHLWPFVIHDLRALGAKKFFGKFCAGSIDHISIRQLQCILMKVSLLLGVELHEGIGFEELLEPTNNENSETLGWRARVSPADHPVSLYEFDTLLVAHGKRNTLNGFKRKEFRGKLAMAITANFINRHSEQEAAVPEISGVAFIFNQKFFKELYAVTGIDLENIVYYKDDTHYFVMTAKKHSLLDKGVLLKDYAEVSRLLSVDNVDRAALMRYAQEAARFSTDSRLPLKDFALNHYGEPDVALFDFTSMYAAENASMVLERQGRRLLCQLVGDSLLEPFWPTGSGCARGFLSALDASWAARTWGQTPQPHPLAVIAERESVYRLLAQTTPENLHRDFGAYTLDPGTRYPNLNRVAVSPHRVSSFYDSDEPVPLDATSTAARKRRREPEISEETLVTWIGQSVGGVRECASATSLFALVRRYRPDLLPDNAEPRTVYRAIQAAVGVPPINSTGTLRDVSDAKIRSYLTRVYNAFKGEIPHVHHKTDVFHQIKQSQQKEKHNRTNIDHPVSVYSNAADTDKSHSSYRKKRRALRTPQVSNDSAEYIRKKIGKLDLNEITQLARLIEGHDAMFEDDTHEDKQKHLQEQILALLDPEDSPDPQTLRNSLAKLLEGTSNTKLTKEDNVDPSISKYFNESNSHEIPVKPPRRLKGLDASSIRVPDFSDIFDDTTDKDRVVKNEVPLLEVERIGNKKKGSQRSSIESSIIPSIERRGSANIEESRKRSDLSALFKRSNSIDSPETVSEKYITHVYEGNKTKHDSRPEQRTKRSGSLSIPDKVLRWQRMTDIIENKRIQTPSPERFQRSVSIGNPEMEIRRQKMEDLINGFKPKNSLLPMQKRTKADNNVAFKAQRVTDMMHRKNAEQKRPKSGGKRKAAREIMRQRFEKSVQLLATEPRFEFAPSADLENDYGLQQYRASAPQFGERVMKLERKLQHYEEGRLVGGGGRNTGGGARVARLAAELSGNTNTNAVSTSQKTSSKPKDLMRSVGKIERDDWNVKEIEKKIMENRLGRPEPKTAEKVPKWDREQFLHRQRRLKEGDGGEERWGEIDETIQKLDCKLRDSGRPDHGTKKVANLANKFVKKEDPEPTKPKEERKSWRGPLSTGIQCAACGTRVFAAEGVIADGLHLHKACFRCAVCKAVLRPGNYTMERYGSRLVCLRHSGVNVLDAISSMNKSSSPVLVSTPERIAIEASDSAAREIDEDEWTDRNCLPSETSCANNLSDEEDSSSDEYTDAGDSDVEQPESAEEMGLSAIRLTHDLYMSDDSFGDDDYSDDVADSSGNESCSRMQAAREARRREVPVDARPPTDSSEVESDEDSDSSDEEVSSATEVSTDSEFAREECAPVPSPPAILVTEVSPAPPPPVIHDYPLSRTRSAGGLATKRALELKRKYLLGEPSPPTVRKSDSTSRLDTKLEAFRSNITEFQKMLNPAPPAQNTTAPRPVVLFQLATNEKKPMPDIIKNLYDGAPVDLLTKGDSPLSKDWQKKPLTEDVKEADVESDSLSEDESSHTKTNQNQSVPRVEVHDEGGELIQLDSLMIINNTDEDSKQSATATSTEPTVVVAESESSESCRDATTLALTETELSDWAAENAVLDECGFEEDKKRNKNPRTLSGPKIIHDAKNLSAIVSHVCGRTSPPGAVVYSNALEHFEFADEGEQDPSLNTPVEPKNNGYMELVDDDYDIYFPGNDRSINFIEKSFETVEKPDQEPLSINLISDVRVEVKDSTSDNENDLKSPQLLKTLKDSSSENFDVICEKMNSNSSQIKSVIKNEIPNTSKQEKQCTDDIKIDNLSLSDLSPPLEKESSREKTVKSINTKSDNSTDELSPPLVPETPKSPSSFELKSFSTLNFSSPCSMRLYLPSICRSASENFSKSNSRSSDSPSRITDISLSIHLSSGSISPVNTTPVRETVNKVQEIKREREEQTEVVRRLVLERLGSGPRVPRKSTRRPRISPSANIPPPVPPPPRLPTPPPLPEVASPPQRPAPPLMPLPVTPSFSDPELARERRRRSIMKSISDYLNRRLGPRQKEPSNQRVRSPSTHKSTGALQEAPPPVPPPPARYCPPGEHGNNSRLPGPSSCGGGDADERDAMQLWFEARWARLVAQRRSREDTGDETASRRLARLERRLTRPLSAEQQAATVAELVQVSAQREAHQALMAADRRRSGAVGD